jgi:transcriptional regulator of arginine metabolism
MNSYARAVDSPTARRDAIVSLVSETRIGSQAELARYLRKRGFHATQATLSRDLRDLGIGKRPIDGKTCYALPGPPAEVFEVRGQARDLEAFVQKARVVGNLVLVMTPPGRAQGVARSIDLMAWPEAAGTIAGDDTVLVVAPGGAQARRFVDKLEEMTGKSLT